MSDDYVELVVKIIKKYESGKAVQVQTPSGKKFNAPNATIKGNLDQLNVWQKVEIVQSILEDPQKNLSEGDIVQEIPNDSASQKEQQKNETISASDLLKKSIDKPEDKNEKPHVKSPAKSIFAKKLEKVAPSSLTALVDPFQKNNDLTKYEKMNKWQLYDMERSQIQPCASLNQWLMFVKYCQEQNIKYAAREVYLAIQGGLFRMRDQLGNEFIGPYKGSYYKEDTKEYVSLKVIDIVEEGKPQIMESIQYKRKNTARSKKQASPLTIEFSDDGEKWSKYWVKDTHPKMGRARGYSTDYPDKELEIVRWFSECYKDRSDSWTHMPNQMFKKSLEAEWHDKAAAEHAHAQAYEPGVLGFVINKQGIPEEDQLPPSQRREPLEIVTEACEKKEEAIEKMEEAKKAEQRGDLIKVNTLKKEIAELNPAKRAEEAKQWEQFITKIYGDNLPIINDLLHSQVGDDLFVISHAFTDFKEEDAKELLKQLIRIDDVYFFETLRSIVEERQHDAGDKSFGIKALPRFIKEAINTNTSSNIPDIDKDEENFDK